MTVPQGLVVDASVAAKWHLTDENHTKEASALFRLYYSGRTDLIAPSLIRYEIANALHNASRHGRITPDQAASEFATFLGYGIHDTIDSDSLVASAQVIAQETGASMYDAVYVAYAELHGYEVVTSDEQLARQMSGRAVPVHLLSELDLS